MDRLGPPMDEEISAQLKKSLEKKGIRVLTSQKVSAIQDQGTGSTVLCQDGTRVEADKILICVGRAADLDCLGALKDRIRLERGKVSVDEQMRTSIPNIYAPGDINGKHMLAHAAFKMGEAAACAAMGRPVTSGTFPPVSIQARRPPGWAFPKKPPGNSTEGKAF